MSTLALKPGFHFRPKSFHPKRDHRAARNAWHSAPWRAISAATGATALAFFCVVAPIIGDPASRLFALDQMSTIPGLDRPSREWAARAFEYTPMMLGPAITAEVLALVEAYTAMDREAEAEAAAEIEAGAILRMPVLEVHALPPSDTVIDIDTDAASRG